MTLLTERTCHFSPCRRYRYMLLIVWDSRLPIQMFIGLNPSTADEKKDDPTIRRNIDYCIAWGKGGLLMANACAFRATDPDEMLAADDPIGPENTISYLEHLAVNVASGRPVACWGTKAAKVKLPTFGSRLKYPLNRADELRVLMGPLDCLRITKEGYPEHPLYLPKALTPIPFNYKPAEAAC